MNELLHQTLDKLLRKILHNDEPDLSNAAQVIWLAINDLQGELTEQEKSGVVRAVSYMYEQKDAGDAKRTVIDILSKINTPKAFNELGSLCEPDAQLALYIKKTMDSMASRR